MIEEAESRLSRQMAGNARLMIVDSLSYDREADSLNVPHAPAQAVRRTSCIDIRLDELVEIAGTPAAGVACRIQAAIAGEDSTIGDG
jgi:hypothetical protein